MVRHRRRLPAPTRSSFPASGLTGRVRKASARTGTGFFSWYTKQLDERPITTKIISSALISASGDIICQILEDKFSVDAKEDDRNDGGVKSDESQKTSGETDISLSQMDNKRQDSTTATKPASLVTDIDWYRTGRFLLIGAFWVAPATHLWYGFLSTRLIPGAATPKRVVQRLFLDQFGAAPVFCPAFMGFLWLLEGKHPSDVKSDLIEAGPTLVTSNWKLWIPAMGFMFSVVPLKFQVVYSNFVGLVWTVYLSYASTRLSSQSTEQE